MGRLNGAVSQRSDSYSFYVDWYEDNIDNTNNTSDVHATAYIYCSAHSAYASGLEQKLTIDGTDFTDSKYVNLSAGVTVALVSGSKTVYHNSDGSKTINITAECDLPDGSGWGPGWGSLNQDISLTQIPRYANFTEHYVQGTGLNSITIHWNANVGVDWVQYSLNGGGWTDTSNLTYTISNLNPNTQYSIRTRIRRADSGLWTESGYIYGTTKDIAKITNFIHFNLGDSVTVSYSNPSGANMKISIQNSDGSKFLAEDRACSGSSYTFNFTDTELDTIYKVMGTANSLPVRCYLKTNNNYLNYAQQNCVLTGNIKTGHTNVNGYWKRTKGWLNVEGTNKRRVRWNNVDGVWKRCI